MKVRTNYRTWIWDRWLKIFFIGHIKDMLVAICTALLSALALVIAIPYLIVEGLTRLILYLTNNYNVVN